MCSWGFVEVGDLFGIPFERQHKAAPRCKKGTIFQITHESHVRQRHHQSLRERQGFGAFIHARILIAWGRISDIDQVVQADGKGYQPYPCWSGFWPMPTFMVLSPNGETPFFDDFQGTPAGHTCMVGKTHNFANT